MGPAGAAVEEAGASEADAAGSEEVGAAAGTVISNGGLYSKVPVKSSIILSPYLSPAGIFDESSNVAGTLHSYEPELAILAAHISRAPDAYRT